MKQGELFEVKEVDRAFYDEHITDFLPAKIIDMHAHVWLEDFVEEAAASKRTAQWPRRVAKDNSIEDLLNTYRLMLPRRQVTPLVFGWPGHGVDVERTNSYAIQVAKKHDLPSLIVCTPEWSAEELLRRVNGGGFLGLKPYLTFAPDHIDADEVTIYDFLPHRHLEVADEQGWIVVLHIPRPGRLRDPVNLRQMSEIERRYPDIHLIIAHVGRAYCVSDVGDAFDVLRDTERMLFDFTANTNADVIERLIRSVGPKRVIFGSDLPIVRMRMRRVCEDWVYINLVPPGLYGDVGDDPHVREVSQTEGERLSFFLYEQLLAFRRAAEAIGLNTEDVEDIFYDNAARVISGAAASLDRPVSI